MKDGWIRLDKQVRHWLPRKGRYTELEALISHTIDVNEGRSFTINGYASLWGWSRTKVRKFINEVKTSEGHHRDIHQTSKGHGIVLIDNMLQEHKNIKKTSERHLKDTGVDTTIKNKNKNKNTDTDGFTLFWNVYPRKVAKADAFKAWTTIAPSNGTVEQILSTLSRQKQSIDWLKDAGKYIPYPATWLRGRRWEDELEVGKEDLWDEEK